MFFVAAKLFWFLVQPINLIGIMLLIAVVAQVLRWRRLALTASIAGFLLVALSVWTSLGPVLLRPLEDRFTRPDPAPTEVAGVIVLGGGLEGAINLVRGGYELNSGGDRLVEAAVLARRYPDARIVVSGGNGSLVLEGEGDADTAPRLLQALGVDRQRLVLENRSRDTYENAVFSRQLVKPGNGEVWLLVTSAFHMPRSMALFRRAGFDVVPWPVDYRTRGDEQPGAATDNPLDSLSATTVALREWIGLLAYWLTGRIDTPLPSPTSRDDSSQGVVGRAG
ncbi:YdcF family protein [Tianweitania sediminis]|uniref:YdcF family protein n=1 Tax=Tianweitania sediminis TaxID=1502156 RepID=A0A8J7R474_9HYPH|nr:YdcF family protein [Tianweitania sediminis]MBP0440803.1 YdcF family protein [Tianweitania sediminis]HEV7415734.1 YdcF family protein [Tianweitania sediminis]